MGDETSKMSEQLSEGGHSGLLAKPGLTPLPIHVSGEGECEPSGEGDESGSVATPKASGRPMIIFDWDDTLLCSTAIRFSMPGQDMLQQLERAAGALLLTSMSLGETLIVTNGTESWIQDSAARYVPGLLPVLRQVTTISARARHEQKFPEDPYAWKREAFRELLEDIPGVASALDATPDHPSARFAGSNPEGLNFLVIGDSWYEIEAARSTFGLPGVASAVKTLKFKEGPTVQDLLGQLRRCSQELSRLVAMDQGGSLGLAPKPLPSHLECLRACASAWSVASEASGSFTFSQPPSPVIEPATSATPPPEPEKPLPAAYLDASFPRPSHDIAKDGGDDDEDTTPGTSTDEIAGVVPPAPPVVECGVNGAYSLNGSVEQQAWVF